MKMYLTTSTPSLQLSGTMHSFWSLHQKKKPQQNLGKWNSLTRKVLQIVLRVYRGTLCDPHGLWPSKLLCLWDFPGKSTRVGCYALLQGFLTQGSNPSLLHCRQIFFFFLNIWATRETPYRGKESTNELCSFTDEKLKHSSVQSLSCVWLFATPWTQHTRPPCPSPSPRVYSNSCPLSQWCRPTISSSVSPSPAFNFSQHQGLFKWVSSSHQVAKVLEFQLQHQSFQGIFRTDFL